MHTRISSPSASNQHCIAHCNYGVAIHVANETPPLGSYSLHLRDGHCALSRPPFPPCNHDVRDIHLPVVVYVAGQATNAGLSHTANSSGSSDRPSRISPLDFVSSWIGERSHPPGPARLNPVGCSPTGENQYQEECYNPGQRGKVWLPSHR